MGSQRWRYGIALSVAILTPLVFSFALAQDIYIPAVPEIVKYFHTTEEKVQMTLSLYMFMIGIGQLVIGPLSDQYGRKSVALISTCIFIIGTVLCAISISIDMLILARVIQAFGACGTFVVSFAIVRDAFTEEKRGKIYSYINGAIALSPLIAPLIGSYLVWYWGWRSTFWFLNLFGILGLLILIFLIVETNHQENRVPVDKTIGKRYLSIIIHPNARFFFYSCSVGVTALFTYFSISPYVLMQLLHISEIHFGFYFATMGICFLIGAAICGQVINSFKALKLVVFGLVLMFFSAALLMVWYYLYGLSLIGFLLPIAIMSFGSAFTLGAGATGALAPFGKTAGTASAVMGSLEFLIPAVIGLMVLAKDITSPLPLAWVLIIMTVLGLGIFVIENIRGNLPSD